MKTWMKSLPDDFVLSEINIPGTHDSATKKVDFSYFSKCQNTTITEQLEMGIRFLDIRVKKTGDKLIAVHAIAKCRNPASDKEFLFLDQIISDCEKFLFQNPSEAIIFSVKRDAGAGDEETFDLLFSEYFNSDFWYLENRIPTLGEVRGKLVFFNRMCVDIENERYNDYNTGLNFSGWPDQSKPTKFPFATSLIARRDGRSPERFFYQDMYRLSRKNKWNRAVLPLLEEPIGDFGIVLNFLSASDTIHSPKCYSRYMLKRFLKIDLVPFTKYGWLIFDFPTEKVCRKVVLTNF